MQFQRKSVLEPLCTRHLVEDQLKSK